MIGEKLKTKVVKKCNSQYKEYLIIDPPYTIFGNSTLRPSFSIIMRVEGLKKMIENLSDDDSFRIEVFHDSATEYSFIKHGDEV